MAGIVTESDLYNFNQGVDEPPPPPGFVRDGLSATDKALRSIPQSASRLTGILVGSLNAPLAFIQGMQNAPTYNPEEWDKMEWYKKPLIMMGGGLESAGRSALKQGDFGEQYSTYYQAKTGSTLEKDFGAMAPILHVGLDLMRDPLVGPLMAFDLAKQGIKTAGQFAKYVKSGATPLEGKVVTAAKGTAEDIAKLQAGEEADLAKMTAIDDTEKTRLRQQIIDNLSSRKDKLTQDQLKLYDEKRAAASRDDATIWAYAHEAQGGEFPDLPVYGKEFESRDAFIKGFDDIIKTELETAQANDALRWVSKYIGDNIAPSPGAFIADVKSVLPEVTTETMWKQALEAINGDPGKLRELRKSIVEKYPEYDGKLKPFKTTEMQAVVGGGYGIEKDESGNITIDPVKAALGMLGGVALSQIKFKPERFTELAKNMSADAQKVASMYKNTLSVRIDNEAITLSKLKNSFVRMVTDIGGNLKREVKNIDPTFGKEVEIRKSLTAGAPAKASNLNQAYHDAIFKDLPVEDYEILATVINSRRTAHIDDYKGLGEIKHPEGLTGVEHLQYLDDLEKADPIKFADLNAKADVYFDSMQAQLKESFNEGLISQAGFNELSKHIYSPRKFLQHLDDMDFQTGGKISVGEEKVIKALDEGSIQLMEIRPDLLLAEVVNRTQTNIFNNRAARALHDFAEVNPGNGIAELANIVRYTKDGKPVYQETPGGFQKIKVMMDGEQKEILMPNEFAKEWVKNDPLINQSLATILRWTSGSTILKAGATGYNPAFALANMARDLAMVWGVTLEYSAHAPVALMQLAKDLNTVKSDVFRRTGRVMDYINEGGGMELLTYYGRFKGQGYIGEKLDNVGKVLGWIGETSEIWTRMALRERALRNGKSAEEATFIARNYLDFNQGGNVIKALDTGLPYLNAGIQATRSTLRAAKETPAVFAYKMAQLGVIASGLYFANMAVNPEVLKNVSDRDKEGNFIITTPHSYTDSEGTPRDMFFKIPKSQGQRVVTTFFEAALARIYEGKYPTEQMLQAIADFANSSLVPPTMASYLAYFGNYDAWTMDQVWKGGKVEPSSEYNAETNPLSVAIGKTTGLSPMRTEAAFNKIVPANNFFVGLVGGGIRAITNAFDPVTEKKTLEEMLLTNQAIKRFVSQTSPMNQYRQDHEEIKTKEVTRRYEQSRDLDKISDSYFQSRDPNTYKMIETYIDSQPPEDQDRLIDRANRHAQVAQLPDKFWWLSAGGMPPKARAEAFAKRWNEETIDGRTRMLELSNRINGFGSEDFVSEVDRIMGK